MGRDALSAERRMWYNAQARARKSGTPFDITVEDIVIPDVCPVLGIPLVRSARRGGSDNSPSLDRIVSERGYVRGNILVVSMLANVIKTSATPEQIRKVYEFYFRLQLSTYDKESR
jgi:hypothetical protein